MQFRKRLKVNSFVHFVSSNKAWTVYNIEKKRIMTNKAQIALQ